jgi:hypothetical protein
MGTLQAVGSGVVGACLLTLVHEVARRLTPQAPQVHVLGMRALTRVWRLAGRRPPARRRRYWGAMAGDLLANALYYSLVGLGGPARAWPLGVLLGLGAGLGALLLPSRIGLGEQPGQARGLTRLLTVVWYLLGGLAAAATYRALTRPRE